MPETQNMAKIMLTRNICVGGEMVSLALKVEWECNACWNLQKEKEEKI